MRASEQVATISEYQESLKAIKRMIAIDHVFFDLCDKEIIPKLEFLAKLYEARIDLVKGRPSAATL